MKDELNGTRVDEFVGLKSKMYSLMSSNRKERKKGKGVNLKLRHKEYADVLFNKKVVRLKMKRIPSNLHSTGTCKINNISLSCFDHKIYILDGINTMACFHKSIDVISKELILF